MRKGKVISRRHATQGELKAMGHIERVSDEAFLAKPVEVFIVEREGEGEDPLKRYARSAPADALRTAPRRKKR